MSAPVTIKGRLTRDPELTFLSSGKPMAKFSVVTNDRFKNDKTGEWEDKDTSFWDCTAFGPIAENICESAEKGTGVIVTGKVRQETWEKDGEKKSKFAVIADDFAVSCKFRIVKVTEGASSNGGGKSYNDEPPF